MRGKFLKLIKFFFLVNFSKNGKGFWLIKTEGELYKTHKTTFFVNFLKSGKLFIVYKK